jgi:O-antigen biosynthesis protein
VIQQRSVSVIVPVKNGARYLAELLDSVLVQACDVDALEMLVVDSGSTDGSVAIAVSRGVRVLEIAPSAFGHGRTRNLGAASTIGEVICFLTQDATPVPGWLRALLRGFALAGDVGAVYGPHLPRPETSPMIARELAAFFAAHEAAGGRPSLQRQGDQLFLSNVNAAYRRDCWESLEFPDVPYCEDQAFARALLANGWAKAYVPEAGVLHAHDYPPVQFMRRYYDEYRGLRATTGHVESFGVRSTYREVRDLVAGDREWMREHGIDTRRWATRSAIHHMGRKVFSALGSQAHVMPAGVQRRLSLEGTIAPARPANRVTSAPIGKPIAKARRAMAWDGVRRYAKHGPAPLLEPLSGRAQYAPLHIACVIPPFSRGSGGHNSILQIMHRLELTGHTVSFWITREHDDANCDRPARIRRNMREWFAPIEGPVFADFDDWYGADIVVATGWQTAHPVMLLPGCRARAYLVQDHEPEFYPTSVESRFAEATYGLDMHAICSSPWLEQLMRDRYGRTTSLFDFGVDQHAYRPRAITRRRDTIALYGRDVTPRRAVPLALMALQELVGRRGHLRVVAFGNGDEIDGPVDYEHLGILSPEQLSWTFSEATVGLVLSLTNYSLMAQEMLACGLPCVDLAGGSAEGVFGDGSVSLSAFDPLALADNIERLLDDDREWARRSAAGIAFVSGRTWDRAARQVEAGLRRAIALAGGAAVR